ncbi:MAG: EAL domain-containing protein (putative c-di-GMP-specific phosphodiesterase class I)/ActR [Candidatus Azotimanducaceae bacterium]|jgi:EAL domain-containing protein (putative c-di-GMP-specific phosphodiesterase class I)/ActR/RegA family two-component response regulator
MIVTLPNRLKLLSILLVDDDDFMLDVVEETLRQIGIEKNARCTGSMEALAHIKNSPEPTQLMICDLNMPGMDGIECMRHLSELNYKGGVIILSGSDERLLNTVGSLLLEHNLNYIGSLKKPVDKEALIALMLKLTDVPTSDGGSYGALQILSVDKLSAGLKTECIEPFFQPKISAFDQNVLGAECLLRWRDSEYGLISPLAVIPVAEAHGLIDKLTLVVFTKAMEHLSDWTRQGHALTVSVNVSMDNLKHLDLPDVLAAIARNLDVNPNQVILEITESRLVGNLASCLEIISRFRLLGFGLSIDDFGTGYSSMEKLKQMPFTELKVDRAFVCNAASDPVARAIFQSSVDLGHALNMTVVAEGAETKEDWDLVVAMGCDQLQGYVVAKPMSPENFIDWKTRWEIDLVGGQ